MFNNLIRFQRDFEGIGGGSVEEHRQLVSSEEIKKEEGFQYPLSFEEWKKEFGVSSKFEIDTATEQGISDLLKETERQRKNFIIRSAQLYNRCTQNKYIQ